MEAVAARPAWYDLSHPIRHGMPVYPGDPAVAVRPCCTHEQDGYRVTALALGTHSGTHVDAPLHFLPGGRPLDAYPPERFHGRAAVLDARGYGPGESIGPEVLRRPGAAEALARAGVATAGLAAGRRGPRRRHAPFVFLCTGWDRYWGEEAYYRHPVVSPELAEILVRAGVGLLGVDTLNPDPTGGDGFPVHRLLLARDVLIAENLRGLEPLVGRAVEAWLLPLPVAGADGAPVRAVARPLR